MRVFRNLLTYIIGSGFILLGIAATATTASDPLFSCLFIFIGLFIIGLVPALLYSPKKSDTVFDSGSKSYAIVFGCVIIAMTQCALFLLLFR